MSPLPYLNQAFVFAWFVIIGTNVASYYATTEEVFVQGALIVVGAAYFSVLFHKQLMQLLLFSDYVLILCLLIAPVGLMLLSRNSFERPAYTSHTGAALVFLSASLLAARKELSTCLVVGAFTIVAVGMTLNLYELFVAPNTWSTAPGRSAGLYINPNISSGALVGYGTLFLSGRQGKLRSADLLMMAMVILGVFTTFSRTGILAGLVLVGAAVLVRAQGDRMWRLIIPGVAAGVGGIVFVGYVLASLDLSPDALLRIDSLVSSGGVGDYQDQRGYAAQRALDLVANDPLFGVGVGTVAEMEEGPHNQFVAVLVDFGVVGLVVYLWVLVRLALIAWRSSRGASTPIWLYLGWLCSFGFASDDLFIEAATLPLMGCAFARAHSILSWKGDDVLS